MPRATRPLLSVLLCLLVLSWGTSPCVLARALDLPASGAEQDTETSCTECCCEKSDEESSVPGPGECPVCKRGGSLRDLPPSGGELTLDEPVEPCFLAVPFVELLLLAGVEVTPGYGSDTGPPDGCALHACPVGIVLQLS